MQYQYVVDILVGVACLFICALVVVFMYKYPYPLRLSHKLLGVLGILFMILYSLCYALHPIGDNTDWLITLKMCAAIITYIAAAVIVYIMPHTLTLPVYTRTLENNQTMMHAAYMAISKAVDDKDAFMAYLCHEIRNPLHAIIASLDIMLSGCTETENVELANASMQAAELMSLIVDDVLSLQTLHSGKLKIEPKAVDVAALVKSVIEQNESRAKLKHLLLTCVIDDCLPKYMNIDPVRLQQILLNLISNAIKFTNVGQITVLVKCVPSSKPCFYDVCFSVEDTGIGIDDDMKLVLFEPYSRSKLSMARQQKGSGLGLSITQRLVALMSGEIDIASTVSGTTVSVSFCLESPMHYICNVETPRGVSDAVHILVVDDMEANRKLMKKMVKLLGMECSTAVDGQDAIYKVQSNRYDVVLMDLSMPVKDGLVAAAELRALGYKVPILALTANALNGEREKAIAAGMNDFLTKPIRRATLELVLTAHVKKLHKEQNQIVVSRSLSAPTRRPA